MSTVYVRWYGKILEGEVAEGEGFMGMTPVRIPLDGHHPVALFMPQHVYESAELAKMQNSPVNSPNSPRIPRKTEEKPREISRMSVEEYIAEVYVTDMVQRFKASHWDEAHNHIRVDSLDEFYRLWLQTHGGKAEAPAITCRYPSITQGYSETTHGYPSADRPCPAQPVPQNGTPSDTKRLHKKKPAKAVELSLFD